MIGARQIFCGELHYPRIPPESWRERLQMAHAMGLNAVSTYVFWNVHERVPLQYDFAGWADVARFVRTAAEEGLDVVLRPGPYICAEWDFGGLPAWLLREGSIGVRTTSEQFMTPVRRWLRRLGEELAPLQRAYGGPIIAVQLENEYGAYDSDTQYLSALRVALNEAGFAASPQYTIDQPGDLARGSLPDVPIAVTFAPGDAGAQFVQSRALRPGEPMVCGEYWAGWFDHWGEPHAALDDALQVRDLDWMVRSGISLNVYMFHGGTNFGFWNGANAFEPHPYQPATSSYDYQAALDEAGRPRGKYFAFKALLERHRGECAAMPRVPATRAISTFTLDRCAALENALGEPHVRERPVPMEMLGQNNGYVLYRAELSGPRAGRLHVDEVRDYAVVSLDGIPAGHLDRRAGVSSIAIAVPAHGATLDILVENGGRINYGPHLSDERKGITNAVRFDGGEVLSWRIYALPLEAPPPHGYEDRVAGGPAFYRGSFELDEPADTFLDMTGMRKGALWINGRNAGRFWEIGPQRSLYVPGVWLRTGRNEVVALELFPRTASPRICGRPDPVPPAVR